jgi:hypothetical protein
MEYANSTTGISFRYFPLFVSSQIACTMNVVVVVVCGDTNYGSRNGIFFICLK